MSADSRTRLLVASDREAAEAAAEALVEAGTATAPRVVREALAGEDDAEDAQWLVIVEAPDPGWSPDRLAELTAIAEAEGGWLETAD